MVIAEAGLNMIETKAATSTEAPAVAPVKLGRPRKAVKAVEAGELVQIETAD